MNTLIIHAFAQATSCRDVKTAFVTQNCCGAETASFDVPEQWCPPPSPPSPLLERIADAVVPPMPSLGIDEHFLIDTYSLSSFSMSASPASSGGTLKKDANGVETVYFPSLTHQMMLTHQGYTHVTHRLYTVYASNATSVFQVYKGGWEMSTIAQARTWTTIVGRVSEFGTEFRSVGDTLGVLAGTFEGGEPSGKNDFLLGRVAAIGKVVIGVEHVQPFGGTTFDSDTAEHTFPVGANASAGFAVQPSFQASVTLDAPITIAFVASIKGGMGSKHVYFKFNNEDCIQCDTQSSHTTISGSEESVYTVTMPSSHGSPEKNQLMYYFVEQDDLTVVLKDISLPSQKVSSTASPPPLPPFAAFPPSPPGKSITEYSLSDIAFTGKPDSGENGQVVPNPFPTDAYPASMNVVKYADPGGEAGFSAGITTQTLINIASAPTLTLAVYVDGNSRRSGNLYGLNFGTFVSGIQKTNVEGDKLLSVRLQTSSLGQNAWSTEVHLRQPFTLNEWNVLTFDFSYHKQRNDLDQVFIQFEGEFNDMPVTAYIASYKWS